MTIRIILAALALVVSAALTVFFLLKDRPRAINPKAFKFTKEERMRFDRSRGLRLYRQNKKSLALKSISIMAICLTVSVVLCVFIFIRRQRFDHLCMLSLIPLAVFAIVLVYNIIMFLKPDPIALTVGRITAMRLVKNKDGREGKFMLKVQLRTGGYVVAGFPSSKNGRENNEEGIGTEEECFVFVTSGREIYVASMKTPAR